MFKKFINERKALLLFLFVGISSTLWFLIRVIPKPSRATYPCMKATAPFMSGLIIYLSSLAVSVFAFRKAKEYFKKSRYGFVGIFTALSIVAVFAVMVVNNPFALAANKKAVLEPANTIIGEPKGYWAGRVVWVLDKDATTDFSGDKLWFESTNQTVVSTMLANGIKKYADVNSVTLAWDCIFKYFNSTHGKGWVGYKSGEKIVIKLNHTNLGAGGHNMSALMNSTPEMVFALLSQLIDSVGVAQEDIIIGDPYRGFPSVTYNKCHAKYPNVHYIEGSASDGREQLKLSKENVFFTSDGVFKSRLPQAYLDASYLINMPCMKTHNSAGITIAAKNHQGTVIVEGQTTGNQYMGEDLHYSYPSTSEQQVMGLYRHLVDFMAHSKLGGNTLVYIVDAIWSGRSWQGFVEKFGMAPFNNDYTSSIFISQDAVAIESVCFDFLYHEYENYSTNHEGADYPLWEGVQDYIHQAADPANWPDGIVYDPDNELRNKPAGSLGVHEHWNNATDMAYSVNLTGEKGGIHLVSVPATLVASAPLKYSHETASTTAVRESKVSSFKLYPNPAVNNVKISYTLPEKSKVSIELFALDGKKVAVLHSKIENAGPQLYDLTLNVPAGAYICKLFYVTNSKLNTASVNLIVK